MPIILTTNTVPVRSQEAELTMRFAETIVAQGAIMVWPGKRLHHRLVGHLAWHGRHRLFWFDAYGRDKHAAHFLAYEELHRVGDRGVCFLHRNRVAAFLSTIESANIQHATANRVSSILWRTVVPEYADQICRLCSTVPLASPDERRRCVWGRCEASES